MPKFTQDLCLNFSLDEIDLQELQDDFRSAVKDEDTRIGDRFLFHKKGLFSYQVLSFDNLLWAYPARRAKEGKSGEQFHNDVGVIHFYTKAGEHIALDFKTPHKSESLFSFLTPTLQQYQVTAGYAQELYRGIEEGGVQGFLQGLTAVRQRFQAEARQGNAHERRL